MGAEGAVSGAAGSAADSSAGAAGAADAAGSSFTLWLGADGCAADAAVLSASEDAESFFGVSVLFFFVSFLVLWAASVSPSHSRADGSTVRPAGWDASRAVVPKPPHRDGKRHHSRGHHLARRTARLLFWCSCIFLSHSACSASKLYSNAASRRQKCFKCHLYVYSIHPTPSSRQCPSVPRAGRFVEVFHHSRRFMWKTNQAAVLLHPKEKKMRSERDFCVFLLLS